MADAGAWLTSRLRHAIDTALAVYGVRLKKTYHHVAEAIWIAQYAWKEMKIEGRI
jgi:hypothetical protein